MTMFDYENQYVEKLRDMEEGGAALPLECVLDNKLDPVQPQMREEEKFPKFSVKPKEPEFVKPEVSKTSNKTMWLPWYESKLHTCLICGEVRVLGLSFKNHIYDSHGHISRKDYKQRFPNVDIEPLVWNCPICKRGN